MAQDKRALALHSVFTELSPSCVTICSFSRHSWTLGSLTGPRGDLYVERPPIYDLNEFPAHVSSRLTY